MRVGTAVGCVALALVLGLSTLIAPRDSWSTVCGPYPESLELELVSVTVDGELQPIGETAGGKLDVWARPSFRNEPTVDLQARWRPGGRNGAIEASRVEVFVDETNHSGR